MFGSPATGLGPVPLDATLAPLAATLLVVEREIFAFVFVAEMGPSDEIQGYQLLELVRSGSPDGTWSAPTLVARPTRGGPSDFPNLASNLNCVAAVPADRPRAIGLVVLQACGRHLGGVLPPRRRWAARSLVSARISGS